MSYTYLFFPHCRLSLSPDESGEDTVDVLADFDLVQSAFARVLPQSAWDNHQSSRGETLDSRWLAFLIADGCTLGMNCSFRADYTTEIQRICDSLGWIAVDRAPRACMPGREPADA